MYRYVPQNNADRKGMRGNMINRKGKGSVWEREIIKMLEFDGRTCTRAAGSMGMWDIVAFNRDGILLIQAKCNGWGSLKERNDMIKFKCPGNTIRAIWRKNDRELAPIIYTPYRGYWVIDDYMSHYWQSIRKTLTDAKKRV